MQRSADTNADRNLPTFEPPVQAQAQPFVPAPLRGTVHIFPSSHSLPSPHCIFSLSLSTHTHYIVFAQAEVEKQAGDVKKEIEAAKPTAAAAAAPAAAGKVKVKAEGKRKPRASQKEKEKKKAAAPAQAATALASAGVTKSKKVRTPKGGKGKGGAQSPGRGSGSDGGRAAAGGKGGSVKVPRGNGKGKSPGAGGAGKAGEKDASTWKAGDWACAKCGGHNFRGKDTCFRCKYAKANSVKAASAESAWDYLTRFAVGSTDGEDGEDMWAPDTVQQLWLSKNVYAKDVNDACFDLYVPYVESLDTKQRLRLLEGARLAATRATQMVEALKGTPAEKDTERGGKTDASAIGKKVKSKKGGNKEAAKGGEKAAAERSEKEGLVDEKADVVVAGATGDPDVKGPKEEKKRKEAEEKTGEELSAQENQAQKKAEKREEKKSKKTKK